MDEHHTLEKAYKLKGLITNFYRPGDYVVVDFYYPRIASLAGDCKFIYTVYFQKITKKYLEVNGDV
jgi:hypothetical protein